MRLATALSLGLTVLTTSPAAVAGLPQPALEEVIVTAQFIEQSAQETPLSLVTFQQDSLRNLGISGVDDIQAQVPNFVIDRFPSSQQTLRLFIRGLGITDVQITQDPAVGVYLDGVYLARSTGLATDVADLERIEVLRGPQGTLYGRNTTGGALNMITTRPDSQALAMNAELGTGDRDRRFAKASINLPLGEQHAIKLAALGHREDGFIDNNGPGGGFGDYRGEAYRFDWRWQANETIDLNYSWDKSRLETFNYTPQAVTPGVPSGTPADAAILSSQRFVTYSDKRLEALATSVPLLPTDTDIEGHAISLRWELPLFTLKSITAWRELEDLSYIDFASGASEEYRVDFSAISLGNDLQQYNSVRTRIEQDQFSQELQLLGQWQGVDVVAGLYYFTEEARENWFPLHHIFSFPIIETGDEALAVNIRAEDNRIENRAMAVYSQATWPLSERWHLSVGWRYSRDKREASRLFRQDNYVDFGDFVLGPFESIDFASTAEEDFDNHAFSFIAEYDWNDNTRLYGKLVEAYKSGGFNTRDPSPEYFAEGFDEEINRTAEVGVKAEWLERALRLNAALFYSDIEDMQLNFLLPNSISDTRVFNSGSAKLSGVELELTTFLSANLLARLSYAYLDTDIDDISDPFTGAARSFYFDNAPNNSASFGVDYRLAQTGWGEWALHLNGSYVDARKKQDANLRMDAYSLLGARLSLNSIPMPAGELTVSAWLKNALDEEYVTFSIDNLPHASRAIYWGEPRSWGLDISYSY
ncbi:TonB-dependent receptor [Halioglobus maricola]|uniref:TonB-dependent receptor n=1 Tax=Halioglobus maricola TaxID=2601894 RepID=A0A5P9NI67_9GAMM|nr:TonB-dependent receptor [Halioglobus maricola]QFU75491.1 TonB-dependent receptor [Halioglobus maricola]